jgi:hypothetical protein
VIFESGGRDTLLDTCKRLEVRLPFAGDAARFLDGGFRLLVMSSSMFQMWNTAKAAVVKLSTERDVSNQVDRVVVVSADIGCRLIRVYNGQEKARRNVICEREPVMMLAALVIMGTVFFP